MADTTADDTLSLYFEIKPGEKADLEVAAAAAIAWAQALKAAAKAIDPDTELRVELVDATHGSLNWNTVMRVLERVEGGLARVERGGRKLKRVTKLAIGLAGVIVVTGPATWDLYFGKDKFTPEDREMLRELHERAAADPDVKAAKKKFYKTVLTDPAIKGVGIKELPDEKPLFVVPQSHFAEGEGLWELEQTDDQTPPRVRDRIMDVIVVKPALVKTPRSWTFREEGLPEFEAVMRDPRVLAAGGLPATMHDGIRIKVKMEFKESFVDGEWQLDRMGRSVVEVLEPDVS